jgi:drug/metabolite transporter (DMT)-like permease
MTESDRARGAVIMCSAAVTMALTGTSVKFATEGLPAPIIVFFRNVFGLLVLLPWLLPKGGVGIGTTRLPLHALRCLFGLGAMYCYFQALARLRLAEAVMLNFTSPLFIPLIARLWLKEPVTRRMVYAVATGLGGVALIMRPGSDLMNIGSVYGIASALFASASLVAVRKLSDTEPPSRTTFYFALGGAIATAFPLPWFWTVPTGAQWIPLIATGACATCAQLLLSKGYALVPAGYAGIYQYLTVPVATLLGWVFWDETLSWPMAFGGALICAAGIIASLPARAPTAEGD